MKAKVKRQTASWKAKEKSDTPAKGGGLVNVTASKAVGLIYVEL
jgi:hypothetical protein